MMIHFKKMIEYTWNALYKTQNLIKKILLKFYALAPNLFDLIMAETIIIVILAFLFYLLFRAGLRIEIQPLEEMTLEEMREAWLKHKDKYK